MPTQKKRKRRTVYKPQDWYGTFLGALANTGNVTLSAQACKIDRTVPYFWRNKDAAFREQWDSAMAEAGELLEAEARRRATVGVEQVRYILYRGELVPDFSQPGRFVDDAGVPWVEGRSTGKKRWSGQFLAERKIEYSDSLLTLLIKGAMPDKYADRQKTESGEVEREARRLADELGVTVDQLLDEARRYGLEGSE